MRLCYALALPLLLLLAACATAPPPKRPAQLPPLPAGDSTHWQCWQEPSGQWHCNGTEGP